VLSSKAAPLSELLDPDVSMPVTPVSIATADDAGGAHGVVWSGVGRMKAFRPPFHADCALALAV
jgi:hypothetical protein